MKKILSVWLLSIITSFSSAQCNNDLSDFPFSQIPYYASPCPAMRGLDNSNIAASLLGKWVTDDECLMIDAVCTDGSPLHFDVYELNSNNTYEYRYTRFAEYTGRINYSFFFDFNFRIDNSGKSLGTPRYMTCYYYFEGPNDLYMSSIIQDYTFFTVTSSEEYRKKIDKAANAFNHPIHFKRYIQPTSHNKKGHDDKPMPMM